MYIQPNPCKYLFILAVMTKPLVETNVPLTYIRLMSLVLVEV